MGNLNPNISLYICWYLWYLSLCHSLFHSITFFYSPSLFCPITLTDWRWFIWGLSSRLPVIRPEAEGTGGPQGSGPVSVCAVSARQGHKRSIPFTIYEWEWLCHCSITKQKRAWCFARHFSLFILEYRTALFPRDFGPQREVWGEERRLHRCGPHLVMWRYVKKMSKKSKNENLS